MSYYFPHEMCLSPVVVFFLWADLPISFTFFQHYIFCSLISETEIRWEFVLGFFALTYLQNGYFHMDFFSVFKIPVIHVISLLLRLCWILKHVLWSKSIFCPGLTWSWDSTAGIFPDRPEVITSGLWIRGFFFPKHCISLLFSFLKAFTWQRSHNS